MCERQATVKATVDCVLWQIEQTQFRTMLANLQQSTYFSFYWRYKIFVQFVETRSISNIDEWKLFLKTTAEKTAVKELLKTNPLFQTLNQFELTTLVDAMHESPLNYDSGSTAVRQGEDTTGVDEEGSDIKKGCFIIASGTCIATITENGEERVVKRYEKGEHFGELALITDAPTRRATVKCTSDCQFYYISKEKFESLVGPVKEILGRDKDKYKPFAEGDKMEPNGK